LHLLLHSAEIACTNYLVVEPLVSVREGVCEGGGVPNSLGGDKNKQVNSHEKIIEFLLVTKEERDMTWNMKSNENASFYCCDRSTYVRRKETCLRVT